MKAEASLFSSLSLCGSKSESGGGCPWEKGRVGWWVIHGKAITLSEKRSAQVDPGKEVGSSCLPNKIRSHDVKEERQRLLEKDGAEREVLSPGKNVHLGQEPKDPT